MNVVGHRYLVHQTQRSRDNPGVCQRETSWLRFLGGSGSLFFGLFLLLDPGLRSVSFCRMSIGEKPSRSSFSLGRDESSGRKSKTFSRNHLPQNPGRISEETPGDQQEVKSKDFNLLDSRRTSMAFEKIKKASRRLSISGIRRSLELQPSPPAPSLRKTERQAPRDPYSKLGFRVKP